MLCSLNFIEIDLSTPRGTIKVWLHELCQVSIKGDFYPKTGQLSQFKRRCLRLFYPTFLT